MAVFEGGGGFLESAMICSFLVANELIAVLRCLQGAHQQF